MRTLDTDRKEGQVYGRSRPLPKKIKRTQAERTEEMRARLSQAAYEAIAEGGYSAFRTAAVVTRAKVSQGALLHHFPSKDAVTFAAIEYGLQRASDLSHERLNKISKDMSPQEIFKLMQEDFHDFFKGDNFWTALDITMYGSKNGDVSIAIKKIVREYRGPLYEIWQEKLIESGCKKENAVKIVRMTSALISGFNIRVLWAEETETQDEFYKEWQDIVIHKYLQNTS